MPCDNLPPPGTPEVCEKGGGGLILPLGGDAEQEWPTELRGVLYLLGLLWCFCGVAIIADVFMAAIEKITSKKVLVTDKVTGKRRTISVWNPTVANLTLMALGSSAPEILLNVIGIFPTFVSGDLGPGTIVGSAAFNLLCIIAVCVIAIPNGELRKIKDQGVFAITAVFSVFAYIWLLIMLMGISPNVVEWWEGLLTFLFFWVLLIFAYLADAGKLPGTKKDAPAPVLHPTNTPEELAEMQNGIQQKYGQHRALTEEELTMLIAYEYQAGTTRAQMRVEATRAMFGGKRVSLSNDRQKSGAELAMELLAMSKEASAKSAPASGDVPSIEFKTTNVTVLESVGEMKLPVVASRIPEKLVKVSYTTKDGSAETGKDFEESKGELEFGPGKPQEQFIPIKIIRSAGYEDREQFTVELSECRAPGREATLGSRQQATVVILDVDRPGVLAFEKEQVPITPTEKDEMVKVVINRTKGSSGKITCKICTESGSAVEDKDFEKLDQEVVFEDKEEKKELFVKVFKNSKHEKAENFRVILSEPTGGATVDHTTDGGSDTCVCTVEITSGTVKMGTLDKIKATFTMNSDIVELGNANYKEQFMAAIYVGGSPQAMKEAKPMDYVSHLVTLPWKLLFATVPPADYAEGWICFFVALGMIGFVTVLIGDMAELLGCVIGMPPAITSITLVAVGTSLPDTFASKTAAQLDPYADNSIGNVTGSNSVNVFLGLGLPWMIASAYWAFGASCEPGDRWSVRYPEEALKYPGGIFVVQAGSLGKSVSIFSCFATICLLTLVARRQFLGGELGGSRPIAILTSCFFVSLWILYIVLSIVL